MRDRQDRAPPQSIAGRHMSAGLRAKPSVELESSEETEDTARRLGGTASSGLFPASVDEAESNLVLRPGKELSRQWLFAANSLLGRPLEPVLQ